MDQLFAVETHHLHRSWRIWLIDQVFAVKINKLHRSWRIWLIDQLFAHLARAHTHIGETHVLTYRIKLTVNTLSNNKSPKYQQQCLFTHRGGNQPVFSVALGHRHLVLALPFPG